MGRGGPRLKACWIQGCNWLVTLRTLFEQFTAFKVKKKNIDSYNFLYLPTETPNFNTLNSNQFIGHVFPGEHSSAAILCDLAKTVAPEVHMREASSPMGQSGKVESW